MSLVAIALTWALILACLVVLGSMSRQRRLEARLAARERELARMNERAATASLYPRSGHVEASPIEAPALMNGGRKVASE